MNILAEKVVRREKELTELTDIMVVTQRFWAQLRGESFQDSISNPEVLNNVARNT